MPGLMGHLLGLERAELARLASAWGLPLDHTNAADIYAEMTDAFAVAAVLDRLAGHARLLLDAVSSQRRHALAESEIEKHLPLRAEDLYRARSELEGLGLLTVHDQPGGPLVTVSDEIAACLDALARLATAADPSTTPLRILLQELPHGELQRLAKRWDIPGVETRLRREILTELERVLTRRESAREAAARLDPLARRALTAVVRSGGRMEMAVLRRGLAIDELSLRAVVRELGEMFLARQAFAGGTRVLFVPLGVGTSDLWPAAESGTTLRVVEGPPVAPPSYPLLWDLLTTLAHLRDGGGRALRLPLSAAQQRRLVPLFREQDPQAGPRLTFLLGLARGLNLLVEDEGRAVLGPRLKDWEVTDFAAQASAAYRWWLGTERWREGLTQGERDTGGPLALPRGRERLVALLAECEPGRWYEIASFIAQVKTRVPLLFRDREALTVAGGQAALERASRYWERWEGKVVLGAITLSLRWLGVVAVANIDDRRCFAMTSLGAWLLGRSDAEEPRPPAAFPLGLRADGDLEVRLAHGPTVAALLRFARPLPGIDPLYRIDRESVVAAVAAGESPDGIVASLAASGLSDEPLVTKIHEWSARVVRLRARQGLVLEAESPSALESLLQSATYARLRLRRLGPNAALVGDEEEFARAQDRLRRDGFVVGPGERD
ncbi:MAG: hypothetical protein ACYC3S_05705 [Chloroflexota bacterium]